MSAHADHERYLRAALHAAADSLEPRSNGLERIQARLQRPRPVGVQWAVAAWNEIFMRAPAAVQDACYWLVHAIRVAWEQLERVANRGRHRTSTQGWLRPVTLMAAVMFIVAAGVYAAIGASSFIFPSNTGAQSGSHTNPPAGHSTAPAPGASTTRPAVPTRPKTTTAASCPPAASATPAPSPAASPSPSPSPSASPTDTSTSTDSSSPSDSGTSPAPSDSASSSPAQNVTSTTPPPASPAPCAS